MDSRLREMLAEYAHTAWSGWMRWMFDKSSIDRQGNCVVPQELYKRWYRQMKTSYEDLSEQEKESDRKEADRMLAIFADLCLGCLEKLGETMKIERWECNECGSPCRIEIHYSDDKLPEYLRNYEDRFQAKVCLCGAKPSSTPPEWRKLEVCDENKV